MGTLHLAANYIEFTGSLGLHYGHLQIVYTGGGEPQEIEVQSPLGKHWDEMGFFAYPPDRNHLDPSNTTGTDDPNKYKIVTIDTGDRDPDEVWNLLLSIHDKFQTGSPDFAYGLGQNSNSYAATLLWMVGIDVTDYLSAVTPPAVTDGFPGVNRNILTNGFLEFGIPQTFALDLIGTQADDFLRTGDADDKFVAGDGDDEYYAGEGQDTLIGGRGNDILDGGEGADTVKYAQALDDTVDNRANGIVAQLDHTGSGAVVDGLGGIDTLSSIETVGGTQFDDVYKFQGNFSSIGSTGFLFDALDGSSEASGDIIDLSGVTGQGVYVSLDTENDVQFVTSSGGGGTPDSSNAEIILKDFENVIGSDFDDIILGDDQDNTIEGGGEIDQIDGMGGADILRGMEGDDVINGGEPDGQSGDDPADRIEGGSGNDTISIHAGEVYGQGDNDTITILGDVASGPNGEEPAAQAYGGSGNDTLDARGSIGEHYLSGGSGDDIIYGNGNSTISAGSGADTIYLQTGDTLADRLTSEDKLYVDGVRIAGTLPTENNHGTIAPAEGDGFFWGYKGPGGVFIVTHELDQMVSTYGFAVFFELNGSQEDFNDTLSSVSYTAYFVTNTSALSIEENETFGDYEISLQDVLDNAMVIPDFRPGDFGLMEPIEVEESEGPTHFINSFRFFYDNRSDDSDNYYRKSTGTAEINGELESAGVGGSSGLEIGDPVPYDEDELRAEAEFEEITEAFSDEWLDVQTGTGSSTGTDGKDLFIGNAPSTSGGLGRDVFVLNTVANVASGGADADFMVGSGGNDTLHGDTGNDRIFGDTAPGTAFFASFDDPQASDDDNLYGGAGDDIVYGGRGDDLIEGNEDNDLLFGEDGNDTILGGDGNDRLEGGSGADDLSGGDGADEITGGTGDDTLVGGIGTDAFVFTTGDGQDVISDFNPEVDTIEINGDTLDPTVPISGLTLTEQGADILISYGTNDTILVQNLSLAAWASVLSNAGDNTLTGTSGRDIFYAGAGNDMVQGLGGNDDLYGGTGDDDLQGGSGSDNYYIALGDGNDVIFDESGGGDDLHFGAGITRDMLELSASDVDENGVDDLVITVSGSSQTVTLLNSFDSTGFLIETIEYVWFGEHSFSNLTQFYSDNFFVGTGANDRYIGTAYSETMYGQAGDDFLFGSNGNDTLYGGDGNDDVFGGNGHDIHYGGAGNDVLYAWYGNDDLFGGTGDDSLQGGHGNDRYFIDLGDGADTIFDQTGTDTLIFGAGITRDMLEFSISNVDGDSYDNLVITISGTTQAITFEDAFDDIGLLAQTVDFVEFSDGSSTSLAELYSTEYFIGTAGNDRYLGTVLDETMDGQAGDDFLFGSNGNDIIHGGDGNDDVFGGNGNDIHYGDAGDDVLFAWEGNDELYGGTGNDDLQGGNGNDRLIGGEGNDTLNGGSGADVFVFNALETGGADTLTDFALNTDTIEMAGITYAELSFVNTGSGTRVEWANGSVEIENLSIASLTDEQFSFV